MKKAIPIVLVLLGLSAYVYFAKILPSREVDPTVRGSGSIEATEVIVAAKLPARIKSLGAEEGDRVRAGQTLVVLDCADLEVRAAQAAAGVAAAQAGRALAEARERQARSSLSPLKVQRDFAQKEQQRAKNLFEAAVASERKVDKAKTVLKGIEKQLRAATLGVAVAHSAVGVSDAQLTLAKQSVALAATGLEECTLKAPSAGVVMRRSHELGELILPGATLFKLGQLDRVYTWIYIPNKEMGRVHLGAQVALAADTYPDRIFVGTITRINENAEFTPKSIQTKEDRTRLVFAVKVQVENLDHALMPGMPVEAELLDDQASAPQAASGHPHN